MFRLVIFVDDKRLPQLLHELTGKVIVKDIQPVANGKAENGKVVPANSGSTIDLFRAYAKANKLREVGPDEMRAFAESIGAADTSYTWYTKKLAVAGVLKRSATRKGHGLSVQYTVVSK